jgi:hypothetical protein
MLATVRSQIVEAPLTVLLQQHRLRRMFHLGPHRECLGVSSCYRASPQAAAPSIPVRRTRDRCLLRYCDTREKGWNIAFFTE